MPVMALEKFGYMLETPPYLTLLDGSSDNALSDADNQQGSRSTNVVELTPQRLHAELLTATIPVSRAYLFGALHDATLSALHRTVRFGQSDVVWLEGLRLLFEKLDQRSWIYREGRERTLWILETSSRWIQQCDDLATAEEQLAYARGYFDTEGCVPHDPAARFYIQLVQKSHSDIAGLRQMLESLGTAAASCTTRAFESMAQCGGSMCSLHRIEHSQSESARGIRRSGCASSDG